MKHFALVLVSILATAWISAARVITYGNFTSLHSDYSSVTSTRPKMDKYVEYTESDYNENLCRAGEVDSTDPATPLPIVKDDCFQLARYFTGSNYGFWTVEGFTNCLTDSGVLFTHGTCSIAVARLDGHEADPFTVGNVDVVVWLHQAMDSYKDPLRMGKTTGTADCNAESNTYPPICWKVFLTDNGRRS